MKTILLVSLLVLLAATGLQAQPPYLITATNYNSGVFGIVYDENSAALASGSLVHLIKDATGDGSDAPSTTPGSMGMPTGDDVLMGTCQIGMTGGAPAAGTFVLPGTAAAAGGFYYLRAFHAASPVQGTYYSESVTEYAAPAMSAPVLYNVQFPNPMIARLSMAPTISVTMTVQNPPVVIGPTGGSFQYTVTLHNNTTQPITCDVWVDVIMPSGGVYGPVILRPNLNMPGGLTLTRSMTQSVPAGAPAGYYFMRARAGNYGSGSALCVDGFPFQKLGSAGDVNPVELTGWETSSWEAGEVMAAVEIPSVFSLAPAFPNPFNPSTQIRFGLPKPARVRIEIYDIQGRLVALAMNQDLPAGYHSLEWSAPQLASGMYLVRMQAAEFTAVEKVVMVK